MSTLTTSLLQSSVITTVLGIVVIAFVAVSIPSLLVTGAKPQGVARAISCYLWKTFGLLLLGMSVLQFGFTALSGTLPEQPVLLALTLLFVVGIGIMVQASRVVKHVDEASSVMPRLVFTHTVEIVGGLVALIAALSIGMGFLISSTVEDWQMPLTLLVLGLVLMVGAGTHIKGKNKKKK